MTLDEKAVDAAMDAAVDAAIETFPQNYAQRQHIEAAITAYRRAREAQGYVEVPVEPTPEMLQASLGWREFDIPDHWPNRLRLYYGTWCAMLSARPQNGGE